MYGSFNDDANEVWDFVRCQRPDGTYYGTSGKCRSGTEVAAKLAKLPKEKLKKLAEHPKLNPQQRAQVLEAIKKPAAPTGWPEAKKPAAPAEKPKKEAKAKPEAKPKAEPKPKAAKPTQEEKVKAAFDKMMSAPKGPEFEAAVKAYKAEKDKLNKAQGKPVEKPVASKPAAKPAAKKPSPSGEKPAAQKKPPTEEEIKAQTEKVKKLLGSKNQKAWEKEYDKLQQMKNEAGVKDKTPKAKTPEDDLKKAQAEYSKILKQQQNLGNKGKYEEANALEPKLKDAVAKMKKAEEAVKAKDATAAKEKEVVDRLREATATARDRQLEYNKRQDETNLSPKQKKAIKDYTDEPTGGKFGYDRLNECSRNPPQCSDPQAAKKLQKELDSAIKALPKNDNGDPFFRGVYVGSGGGPLEKLYNDLENAKPGEIYKDPAFGSYSTNYRTAGDFAGSGRSIVFVSRNKQLTPINRFSEIPDEDEALLPRGTSQTIRSVTKLKDQLIVELD